MSQNQVIAYRALRSTLPPQAAKWFALNRRFAVANRRLLPVLVSQSPLKPANL